MRAVGSLVCVVAITAAIAAPPHVAYGQRPAGGAQHDHRLFTCLENGLANGQTVGCQLLARVDITPNRREPLFWHLATFATHREAETAKEAQDVVVEAEGRTWLSVFGPRSESRPGARLVASIGPLPLPEAKAYRVELYHVVMQPGMHTQVHTHPGPEAWYMLAGEQCLETPAGTIKAKTGEGTVGPAGGTPMQLTNNGTGLRRALFIVIHDPALPWTTPSDWKPAGTCDR